MDPIDRRIEELVRRVKWGKKAGLHFYLRAVEDIKGARVIVRGREMLMFASYCYLDLLGHPKINAAAKAAIDKFGSGTQGVRILAGTTTLHDELEERISTFKDTEAAIVYSSGYVTNLAAISALCGRGDVIICDKLDHASIVDGCLLSRAKFVRFEHNNMEKLEQVLAKIDPDAGKLLVVDAVFSMDGDVINLPEVSRLAKKYGARLMVDEAHSLGVLGETGHGIEEHFGMTGEAIDIYMGTLSKNIPSVGGYIAGDENLITYLKHMSRAFVFSAALPPAAVAAAAAAFDVIEEEPERLVALRRNVDHFLSGLKELGFNTLNSETPIVPIVAGEDEPALMMAKIAQEAGIFILPIVSPAVPRGTSRLRANVTAAHTEEDIAYALSVFEQAGKEAGVI